MSPTSKLIELYLRERGEATIDELRDELDIPLLQLYPVTDYLVNERRIERDGDVVYPVFSR